MPSVRVETDGNKSWLQGRNGLWYIKAVRASWWGDWSDCHIEGIGAHKKIALNGGFCIQKTEMDELAAEWLKARRQEGFEHLAPEQLERIKANTVAQVLRDWYGCEGFRDSVATAYVESLSVGEQIDTVAGDDEETAELVFGFSPYKEDRKEVEDAPDNVGR